MLPRALVVAALTAACAAGPLSPGRSAGPDSSPAAVGGQPATTAAADTAGHGAALDSVPASSAVPVDPAAAPAAAEALVRAYARPDLDPLSWLAGVTPLLSPTAAAAVEGTDPALVPASAVTGPAVVLEAGTPLLALLDLPTDGGPCRVLLSWDDGTGRWQGERVSWTAGTP